MSAIDLRIGRSSGTPKEQGHALRPNSSRALPVGPPYFFLGNAVTRGKPAPDLFLFAAEQMRAEPARCLVIEDSVPGVTGAVAAGMTVLGFHERQPLPGGPCRHAAQLRRGAMFDDMRQLPDLVRQVGAAEVAS